MNCQSIQRNDSIIGKLQAQCRNNRQIFHTLWKYLEASSKGWTTCILDYLLTSKFYFMVQLLQRKFPDLQCYELLQYLYLLLIFFIS